MSIQRGYYQVPSTKLSKDASSKASNVSYSPLTAVYTNGTLASSGPRAGYTKPYTQPKIMSPATCYSSQRRKYVTSLSIIPKEKIPEVVVLPSIDKDIAVSSARSVSPKILVVASGDKAIRETSKSARERKPKAKYVSCLQTSLSTEWRKESFDKEIDREETARRATSLQIECNYKTIPTTVNKSSTLSRVGDKADSRVAPYRTETRVKGPFSSLKNCEETLPMDKQTVRIQNLPASGKSFTIKDTIPPDAKRVSATGANVVSARGTNPARPGLRPRMLPKSRFRVKIQKCHHKSVNISDSYNYSEEKRDKTLVKASRSVVVQEKSPQRSFSVQKHNF